MRLHGPTQRRAQNERTETEINNYDETKTQTRMFAFPKDEDETRMKSVPLHGNLLYTVAQVHVCIRKVYVTKPQLLPGLR